MGQAVVHIPLFSAAAAAAAAQALLALAHAVGGLAVAAAAAAAAAAGEGDDARAHHHHKVLVPAAYTCVAMVALAGYDQNRDVCHLIECLRRCRWWAQA